MDKHIPPQTRINRSRRETIQSKQDMGEQDKMSNKINVEIQLKGDLINTIFTGNLVSMDIDLENNTGTFEVSRIISMQPKKEG